MSRVAKNPITIPSGVEVKFDNQRVKVKGAKGELEQVIPNSVDLQINENVITFATVEGKDNTIALSGTMRALVNNMVEGVSKGFEKKLTLVGVGYRAQVQGKSLNLILGYSHPINFAIPDGIQIECPSQTEVVVKGADKQMVGQVAANIRAFRSPEPYKGKGIRYSDERISLKEAKKK